MKGLMILENGFEDTEALASYDVLFRAGIVMESASIESNEVVTQVGHTIKTNKLLKDVNVKDYDFLVIPGGKAVMQVLQKSKGVENIIRDFYNANKLIAAICAAPSLLGRCGYFEGLTYTCFPSFEEFFINGKKGKDGVITSGNFITATSMYYSIEFGLAIVEKLLGHKKRKEVELSLQGK